MFSEETLSQNLAALDEVRGQRPSFSALDPETTRVADVSGTLRVEIRSRTGDEWVALWGDDPLEEAAACLVDAGETAQYLVIGDSMGHIVDALEQADRAATVVLLEPDPGVAVLLLARRNWGSCLESGRLRLLTGPDYTGASACARLLDGSQPSTIIVNDVLAEHRPEAVEQATHVARRIQQEARANEEAKRVFAGPYLLQTLGNLPVIKREGDIAALEGAFTGRPAVMVAAGPSLDHSLNALAAYQDQVVIVASDTTVRPLLAAGIRPHLVVGADPGETNARHLSGLPDASGIWLAAEGSLHPSVFPPFAGRTFTFKVSDHEPWPWYRAGGLDRGTLRTWGSVATSALDLALLMGCDPIIFVGHDLAYTDGRPYCDNTVFHEEWRAYLQKEWGTVREDYMRAYEEQMMEGRPLVPATDIAGRPVQTTAHLLAFREWIVEQTTATRDRSFVNASGGGILQGPRIKSMAVKAALNRFAGPPLDVRATLSTLHSRTATTSYAFAPPDDDVIAGWVAFTAGTADAQTLREAIPSAPIP